MPPIDPLNAIENIYTPRQRHVLLIASLIGLAGLMVFGLAQYLTAFLAAGILFVVFRPIWVALVHKRRWNRRLVTIGILVLTVVVLVIPFYALSSLLINRLIAFAKNPDQILTVLHKLEQVTGIKITEQQNVRQLLQQGASVVSRWLTTLASSALNFLVVVGLMLFTMYYLFMQETYFLIGLRRYLPFRSETMHELGESLKNNVNANVLGQALVALVQAILTGLTLWIFQVPDPLFWGVVAFFMAFLPVLGTPLVWGPAALYQFSQGHNGQAIGILLVGVIVIINVDNLLRILLAKRMGDIHPLVTLVGLVLGVEIFGIIGLVVGPLLVSYFLVLMEVFRRENRAAQKKKHHTPPAGGSAPAGIV
ncbi:AI-2E family transporter [Hymenobacter sp. 15J16-1T3B]|uniref:AI-2E family transporter n=1 Tax=Hymenobacter sp. 15J16-1T3B TaxID=2886941 RepID=UPI001D1180A0|nr:AI-2E family transporter [Hymenobacter sp. 15J16-1T3B]MCC3158874.1 AI-2E family transporter [Hymenobacter sp. 15J16-1T3B]